MFNDYFIKPHEDDDGTIYIYMPRKTLKRKPMVSTGIFKHEEGHYAYKMDPKKYSELMKKAQSAIDKDKNNEKFNHGISPEEYVADVYSAKHSQYGAAGFKKMINSLRGNDKKIKDSIKNINIFLMKNKDITSDEIKSLESKYSMTKKLLKKNEQSLLRTKQQIKELKIELSKAKRQNASSQEISDLTTMIDNVEDMMKNFDMKYSDEYKRELQSLKTRIDECKNKIRSPEKTQMLIKSNSELIKNSLKHESDLTNNEMNLRQKFVKDNIKESTDVLLEIYESEYYGLITRDERDFLIHSFYGEE